MSDGRLLLVLPLRIYNVGGRLFTDTQACNGLRLWLNNFNCVTLAGPAEKVLSKPSMTSPIDAISGADRISVVPLPLVYVPHHFVAALPKTIALLKTLIVGADYLQFAIGGLWGDWASVGCLIAQRLGLPYAVWTDRVESVVAEFHSKSKNGLRRLSSLAVAKVMARYERHLIRRSALGLFHGMDCYDAYARYCGNPHVVHNVHQGASALISERELDKRLFRPQASLRLIYAGRVHLDKGVFDWIEALSIASNERIDFTATWYGTGPELEAARADVTQRGLSSKIKFPGSYESSKILRELHISDAFVFCHKTPEAPRCLIEALMCGLPIVGYDSNYPRDLIRHGGGMLMPVNDPRGIAQSIAAIQDRTVLSDLSHRALADGRQFTDEKVFYDRSVLMKTVRVNAIRKVRQPHKSYLTGLQSATGERSGIAEFDGPTL
jgi:colanic acid/amylovoran biosynthesis glycosyltransferase